MDPQERRRLEQALRAWEQGTLREALEDKGETREGFTTTSSVPIRRLYTPIDTAEGDYLKDLGFPGEYPFTRGIHPSLYRGRLWTMRQFAGFGSAEDTNARYKLLLEHGETGLSVAFDMPTLYGRDTDDPRAAGEFGICGVAVPSLREMEILFGDVRVDRITTSMTINGPAAITWGMYIAMAEKRGIPASALGGTLQNDILKEYQAQKEWIFPPEPSMELVVDTIEYATRYMPKWNPISISGYHIREAGSTAVQELAFTLANGFEYVRWCVKRGMDVDAFAPRLSFFFNCHNDLFEEVAKFRAARRIWAREMKETFGAKNPRSWWLRFHTQTAGVSLTAQQPENNVVRVAIQALAAVLGGTQSLHTNSMDEAFAVPTEKAVRIALRTQQIIAHESGIATTVDPLGGSYFIEALTDETEEAAYKYFKRIEQQGGVIPAIKKGFFQREISQAAYDYQRQVESGDKIVVGVNAYQVDEPPDIEILRVPKGAEARQVERLQELRRTRDNRRVKETLEALKEAARHNASPGRENLMTYILDAVRAHATLGEMTQVLKEALGTYEEPILY